MQKINIFIILIIIFCLIIKQFKKIKIFKNIYIVRLSFNIIRGFIPFIRLTNRTFAIIRISNTITINKILISTIITTSYLITTIIEYILPIINIIYTEKR